MRSRAHQSIHTYAFFPSSLSLTTLISLRPPFQFLCHPLTVAGSYMRYVDVVLPICAYLSPASPSGPWISLWKAQSRRAALRGGHVRQRVNGTRWYTALQAIGHEFADENERLGPWWYISQAVDFPDQLLPMLPSISDTSLAVNDSACRSQTAACPLPLPKMLTLSGGYEVTNGPLTQSGLREASKWDKDYTALLNLSGSGR